MKEDKILAPQTVGRQGFNKAIAGTWQVDGDLVCIMYAQGLLCCNITYLDYLQIMCSILYLHLPNLDSNTPSTTYVDILVSAA